MAEAQLAGSYTALVRTVTDGDTIRCDVLMGSATIAGMSCDIVLRDFPVRLRGCNAAEVKTEAGKAARDNLRAALPGGTPVTLSQVTPYKYGLELVAAVALPDGADLVGLLIKAGWAAPWDGNGKQPVPPWPRGVPA